MKKRVNNFLYERESYLIRGACFEVWKKFGSAYKEEAVDRALTLELEKRGLQVENQKRLDIIYLGKKVGSYVPDKVIKGVIILELKRKSYLTLGGRVSSGRRSNWFMVSSIFVKDEKNSQKRGYQIKKVRKKLFL